MCVCGGGGGGGGGEYIHVCISMCVCVCVVRVTHEVVMVLEEVVQEGVAAEGPMTREHEVEGP